MKTIALPSLQVKQGKTISLFYLIVFEVSIGLLVAYLVHRFTSEAEQPKQIKPFPWLMEEMLTRNWITEHFTGFYRDHNIPFPSYQNYRGKYGAN